MVRGMLIGSLSGASGLNPIRAVSQRQPRAREIQSYGRDHRKAARHRSSGFLYAK